jgi:hypothetical protein
VLASLWLKPALLLSCSLIITQGLFLSLSYGAHEEPTVRAPPQHPSQEGKWVGYGMDPLIETEVKGIIIYVDGDNLYVIPDPDYRNLVIKGNSLRPSINDADTKSEAIEKNLENLNLPSDTPIIKMEMVNARAFGQSWMERVGCTYGPDPGATEDDCGPGPVRFKYDDPYKKGYPLRVGDHIKVTGLYVIELQHVMYYPACRPPFAFFQGIQKLCWGHAEIHPYNVREIEYVPPLEPGDTNTESHTVVHPVYRQFYDHYLANGWAQNRLVHESRDRGVNAEFFIRASDQPPECRWIKCNLNFSQKINAGSEQNIVSKVVENGGARIKVNINDFQRDKGPVEQPINDPTVFKATWSLGWKEGQGPTEDQAMRFTSVIDGNNQQIKLRGFTYSSSMQFHFESLSAPTDRFLCSLDGADFVECKSGYTLADLRLGRHALVVKLDLGGAESLPEVFIWKNIQSPPESSMNFAAAPRIGSGEEYSEQEENSEPQADESFKEYRSYAVTIKMLYPRDWQVEEYAFEFPDYPEMIEFWPQGEDNSDPTSIVTVFINDNSKKDVAGQIKDEINSVKEHGYGDTLSNVREITVADVPAYTFDYEAAGEIYRNVYVQRPGADQVLNLEYIGDDRNIETFQKIVNSLEFFSAP